MDRLERLAKVFRALSAPQRLALFEYLRAAGRENEAGGCCVNELASAVKLSLSTVSYHLKELQEAGLICREKRGQHVWCAVRPDAFSEVRDLARQPAPAAVGTAVPPRRNCC